MGHLQVFDISVYVGVTVKLILKYGLCGEGLELNG
jgi:hypothetical protein